MKRILLIQPAFFSLLGIHSRYFPYHLICIGTYLKNSGHDVMVVDGDNYSHSSNFDFAEQENKYKHYIKELKQNQHPYWESIRNDIKIFNPHIIGITFWTTFMASSIRTAELCRIHCPQATIIAGGPHITLVPDDMNQLNMIDIAIIGEGEQTFLEVANDKPLNNIKGIIFRSPDGIKEQQSRPFIDSIDSFGVPDRSLLSNIENYSSEDLGLIMTSRGCPFNCAYCATSIWKRKVRYRNIDTVLKEIKMVNKEFGTIYFTIKDDSFIINRDRILEFCSKLIKNKLKIFWECNVNLINIDKSLLVQMKKAGCIAIKIGIESGSDRIHKIINKKLTNDIIKRRWEIIKSIGIHATCYVMMGVPGETRKDVIQTIKLVKNLKPDYISYSVYEIFPSTRLHCLGIKKIIDRHMLNRRLVFNS